MASQHELLTVSEVADRLRVSTMTVYRLIQRDELQALRIGRSYRIHTDALDDFLQFDVVREDATAIVREDATAIVREDATAIVREDATPFAREGDTERESI